MAGGQPTKLKPDILQKAADYANGEWANQTIAGDVKEQIPSAAGLACYLGVCRATIYNWADKGHDSFNEKFLDILSTVQRTQEKVLLSMGLSNKFNSTITKLILTKHDYSDKVVQENKDPQPVQVTFVEDCGED